MGADRNKVFLPLAGKPILVRSVEACLRARGVSEVLLVAHPQEIEEVCALVHTFHLTRIRDVIAGGATRHASEYCALNALRPGIEAGAVRMVLIHDAARPLARPSDIERLIVAARTHGALLATPGEPNEIVARVTDEGLVSDVYAPHAVWHAQTPQAFQAKELLRAYDEAARAGFEGTDTAATVERLGLPVRVVKGSFDNIKVTTPMDLALAEALLAASATRGQRGADPVSRR
jgi:2-C-methyl-D-erythritol 4-phosphate cytidylyltransferase